MTGAIIEGLTPHGIVRRLNSDSRSFEAQKIDYLNFLQKDAIPQMSDEINRRRNNNGLKKLQLDSLLSQLAQASADAVSKIPDAGSDWTKTFGAQIPERIQADISKQFNIAEKFADITVAADSVIGIAKGGTGKPENQNPLIYSFQEDDILPLNPILTKGNLDSLGIGVALDDAAPDASNRIIFVVAAERIY